MQRIAITFIALLMTTGAQAQVTSYATRGDFNTANPGVPTETFGAMNLPANSNAAFTGPLNAATNNAIFATGSVLSGFDMNATTAAGALVPNGSLYAGNNCCSTPATVVSTNFFDQNIQLDFASAITAFAIDLYGFNGVDGPWSVSLNGAGGLIGTYGLAGSGFFGVTSIEAITSVYLNKPDTGGAISNLSFGAAGPGAVPEPGTWALMIVGFAASGMALRARRKLVLAKA